MAFQRIRVRFEDEGKVSSVVTLAGERPEKAVILGRQVIRFSNQENGDLHIVETSLIRSVTIEEEDPKYATFSKVADITGLYTII